jgi:hypothetical protein
LPVFFTFSAGENMDQRILGEGGLLRPVDVPVGRCGKWAVERFTVSKDDAAIYNLRLALSGEGARSIKPGTYTRLVGVNADGKSFGDPMMSDTPAEMRDHWEPVHRAAGNVLLAGLGIGLVLQAILDKRGVSRVTVVEKDDAIITLVAPHYLARYGGGLRVVHADINTWRPARGEFFDVVWFDIWSTLNTDNLKNMGALKRRFARCSTWRGCWGQEILRWHKQRERAQRR